MKTSMVKSILILLLHFIPVVCAGDTNDFTHSYKDGTFHVYIGTELIWKVESDPAQFEILEVANGNLLFILKYEPSFEIGDVWIFAFDKHKGVVTDTLKLLELDKIENHKKNPVVMAKINKYGFREPGAPLWPKIYRLEEGVFNEDRAEMNFDFSRLAKETSVYIGNAYLICDGQIGNCFYQSEYEKAVKQLRDASDLMPD